MIRLPVLVKCNASLWRVCDGRTRFDLKREFCNLIAVWDDAQRNLRCRWQRHNTCWKCAPKAAAPNAAMCSLARLWMEGCVLRSRARFHTWLVVVSCILCCMRWRAYGGTCSWELILFENCTEILIMQLQCEYIAWHCEWRFVIKSNDKWLTVQLHWEWIISSIKATSRFKLHATHLRCDSKSKTLHTYWNDHFYRTTNAIVIRMRCVQIETEIAIKRSVQISSDVIAVRLPCIQLKARACFKVARKSLWLRLHFLIMTFILEPRSL